MQQRHSLAVGQVAQRGPLSYAVREMWILLFRQPFLIGSAASASAAVGVVSRRISGFGFFSVRAEQATTFAIPVRTLVSSHLLMGRHPLCAAVCTLP